MNTTCVDPRTDQRWKTLIANQRSDVFHSPNWLKVITDTYRFDLQAYLLLGDDGTPQAGIPFCRLEGIKPKRLVTLPFSDYCDPLVTTHDQWASLKNRVLAESCPFIIRCLHNPILLTDKQLQQVGQAKWHGLDLQPDLETLWQGVHASARRAIRKAEQAHLTIRAAERKEELRAFFDLHLRIRKYKYQLVAQPYEFFERIWNYFIETEQGFLLLAVHQEQIIGGVLFLIWQNRLYYKFNASLSTELAIRPNDLLLWEGVKRGKATGCRFLDFGLSDWNQSGLIRYKRKYATTEKSITFLKLASAEVQTQAETELGQLLPQLTDLFTNAAVPDPITEKAGNILYRFFT